MSNKAKGAVLTVLGGCSWGLSGSMGQYLFSVQHMDSRWLVPVRLFLAGILMFSYNLVKYRGRIFEPWKTNEERLLLLVYGLLGVSLCQFLYFLTIQLSTAGTGTILQSVSPAMILLVTCFTEKRKPRFLEILAIILAFAGVFLITTHGKPGSGAVRSLAIVTGLTSAVCVTVYNVVPAKLLEKYPVTILQSWAFLMGGLLCALIFRPWNMHFVPNAVCFLGIAVVVIVGNIMAFTFYMTGVKLIGPSKAILYGFSEPVTAAVVSTLLLGSPFGIFDALGFLLIFVMMVIISRSDSKKAQG